jgi:hypothetical protein
VPGCSYGQGYGGKLTKATQWMNHRTDQRKDGPKPHHNPSSTLPSQPTYCTVPLYLSLRRGLILSASLAWRLLQTTSQISTSESSAVSTKDRTMFLCDNQASRHKGAHLLGVTDQLRRRHGSGYPQQLSKRRNMRSCTSTVIPWPSPRE